MKPWIVLALLAAIVCWYIVQTYWFITRSKVPHEIAGSFPDEYTVGDPGRTKSLIYAVG